MLRRLLDVDYARGFLSSRLKAFTPAGGLSLSRLEIREVKWGRHWSILFNLTTAGPANGVEPPPFLAVLKEDTHALERCAARLEAQLRHCSAGSSLSQFMAICPDRGLLLSPFPLDPGLGALPAAFRSFSARARLARAGLSRWAGLDQPPLSVQVLRYVPGRRCQLLYQAQNRRSGGECLGKIFHDNRGQQVFETMVSVYGLFQSWPAHDLYTPRPLAYLDDWKMLLQERVRGHTLLTLIRLDQATTASFRSAARCLAVLHSGQVELKGTWGLSEESRLLDRWHKRLAELGLAEEGFHRVYQKLRPASRDLRGTTPPVPIHRDFYDKQLLLSPHRTALIDLDTAVMGPPELDLANFVAHLGLRGLQLSLNQPRISRWAKTFLAEYSQRVPRKRHFSLYRFFLASAYFRLAGVYRFRREGIRNSQALLAMSEGVLRDDDVVH